MIFVKKKLEGTKYQKQNEKIISTILKVLMMLAAWIIHSIYSFRSTKMKVLKPNERIYGFWIHVLKFLFAFFWSHAWWKRKYHFILLAQIPLLWKWTFCELKIESINKDISSKKYWKINFYTFISTSEWLNEVCVCKFHYWQCNRDFTAFMWHSKLYWHLK